ncbi:hypothetical protein BV25DRAFT_1538923 [Artomyces pyxidatus]|uniref:Uncharacterized protein n=1 Tax=Artomyces pyxidatus TaxID=48021 RepID=A0ACB8SJU6_9AGAM|nr:hypothetical protein BV25DRAFT_1538923 [Artomyces pyxidatus]
MASLLSIDPSRQQRKRKRADDADDNIVPSSSIQPRQGFCRERPPHFDDAGRPLTPLPVRLVDSEVKAQMRYNKVSEVIKPLVQFSAAHDGEARGDTKKGGKCAHCGKIFRLKENIPLHVSRRHRQEGNNSAPLRPKAGDFRTIPNPDLKQGKCRRIWGGVSEGFKSRQYSEAG